MMPVLFKSSVSVPIRRWNHFALLIPCFSVSGGDQRQLGKHYKHSVRDDNARASDQIQADRFKIIILIIYLFLIPNITDICN